MAKGANGGGLSNFALVFKSTPGTFVHIWVGGSETPLFTKVLKIRHHVLYFSDDPP